MEHPTKITLEIPLPIGRRIAVFRHIAGITQFALGLKLGTSQTVICQTELGYIQPSDEKIGEIAEALRITVSTLRGTEDEPGTG